MLATDIPYDVYFDTDGKPLDGGRLYFGSPNQNPETNPITVYWDVAGTQPAAQPIRTLNGWPARNGTPAVIYAGSDYSLTVKDRRGRLVFTAPSASSYSNDQNLQDQIDDLDADLLSPVLPTQGAGKVGWDYAVDYPIGTIGWALKQTQISVKWFGAKGDGANDDTTAIQAAIDFLPKFGSPNWRPGGIWFPTPQKEYRVTAALKVVKRQGYSLRGDGAVITGGFAGYLLEVGDSSGSNDVLWTTIDGLEFIQQSTAVGSGAVKAAHNYTVTYSNCRFYGGEYSFNLDGNANLISRCSFRASAVANVKTGASANNESNLFLECSNETSAGLGYDLSVAAGVGGFTHIIGGYCEANALGNISCVNSMKAVIEGVYFNLQNGAAGVILGGTVGPNYAEPQVKVSDCRIEGPSSGTPPKFISELSANSICCVYENNTVRAGLVDLYGSAGKSTNLRRRRDRTYVSNADTFAGGPPPTGWTLVGPGPATAAAGISPYGSGAAAQITGVSYIYQLTKFPANALLRVSCWALTTGTDATLEMRDAAGAGTFNGAIASVANSTPTRLEFYIPPSARTAATSGRLMLRNQTGVNNAYFDNIVIEDMTN